MASAVLVTEDNSELDLESELLQEDPLQEDPLLEEKTRARAHQIWLERDGRHGSEMEDWLQAEAEVRREMKG